jgi:hypothetical protein
MLFMHLRLVEDEATKRLMGQYAEGIMVFDNAEKQARQMADLMSQGIIRQFRL